ncbi:MAG TPA: 16S rRNA (uracil(1498)-N(3))-methyltransferase [Pseudoclavibacter sp.]|nr:16S rRNA (uracil(1498)-N(3))-methyltransferase [Pseudoclavibacter sp.]
MPAHPSSIPGPLFYTESLPDTVVPGFPLSVHGEEAHHAVRVRRIRAGEQVSVGDGHGRVATGPVVAATPDHFEIEVAVVRVQEPQVPELVLAQALAKGDRDELAIQAATEVGIDRVVPWQAQRSISQWRAEKAEKNRQRWQAIVREASKQSLRARIPSVTGVTDTPGLCHQADTLILLDPEASLSLSEAVARHRGSGSIMFVIGPEGGVSAAERELLVAAGAVPAVLGRTVLRTSTAGPVATALAQQVLGRW